ncbi:MAG: hypothetical protein M1282_05510, partial [Chloroflexi bacterium]|nr:hypothetical protein [Chloroflexota bacterium]
THPIFRAQLSLPFSHTYDILSPAFPLTHPKEWKVIFAHSLSASEEKVCVTCVMPFPLRGQCEYDVCGLSSP